ncbi:MAG: helix-turn-helix domain-containing protein, partial [Syntrophaceae bacterium]|nr:helix-turn-helix domain-containing protein [Syntrophaceae bacterium]
IAENIIKIRDRLSQAEFAKRLGTKKGIVHSWESGKSMPGSHYLQVIHRVFGVNINWLLTGEGEPYIKKESQAERIDHLTRMCEDLQKEVKVLKEAFLASIEREEKEVAGNSS